MKINCKKNSVQILFKKVVFSSCKIVELRTHKNHFQFHCNPFFSFQTFSSELSRIIHGSGLSCLVGCSKHWVFEKEGKLDKLTVTTFVYCSICFFILWPKGRMSALCFPYQDQLTCLCDRVGRVLSCQSGQAWNNYLYKYQSICLLLFKIDLQKYLAVILCLAVLSRPWGRCAVREHV